MKYKKWLPIVVAILFLINLAAFIVFKVIDLDLLVRDKITRRITSTLNAEVTIDDFTLDDQQVNISGMTIDWREQNMKLTVDQVYIRYKLRKLLFSGFSIPGVIDQISIYNPRFDILIESAVDKSPKEFPSLEEILENLPDLSGYFNVLTAENGTVSLRYDSPEITVADTIRAIRIYARNEELCHVGFTAGDSLAGLTGSLVMQRGEFLNADVKLSDYRPDVLDIPMFDDLDFRFDSHVHLTKQGFRLDGAIRDLRVDYRDQKVRADSIAYEGSLDSIMVRTQRMSFNGDPVRQQVIVTNPLKPERRIEGTFHSVINVQNYVDSLDGHFEVDGNLTNETGEILFFAGVSSDSLRYGSHIVRDIKGNLEADMEGVRFDLNRLLFERNRLSAQGVYNFEKGLHVDVDAPGFIWDESGLVAEGNIVATVDYHQGKPLVVTATMEDFAVHDQYIEISDLSADIDLTGDQLSVRILERNEHLEIALEADLAKESISADLQFTRFDLKKYLPFMNSLGSSLPAVNGNVHIIGDRNNIQLDSRLRIYEERYGMLDGFLITNAVIDLLHERTYLHVRTRSGVYNYEPIKFHMLAAGDLQSLHTLDCRINDQIAVDLHLSRKPELDFGFRIRAKDIVIPDYLQYFMNNYNARKFEGETDFDFAYNMDADDRVKGWLTLEDFRYENVCPLSTMFRFSGTKESVQFEPFMVTSVGQLVSRGEASVHLEPKPSVLFNLSTDDLDLKKLFMDSNNRGTVSGAVNCRFMEGDDHIEGWVSARDINLSGFQADSIYVEASQESGQLRIDTLYAYQKPYFEMNVSGAIGYNFLREKAFEDSSVVKVAFSGDFLKMLSDRFSFLHHGQSSAEIKLELGLKDEQFNIRSGNIQLKDGEIKPDYFNTKVRDIQIDMRIEDDILNIEEFSLGTEGPGRLHIENDNIGAEDQFKLGTLQMGYFYAYTDQEGIWASIPWYMPENTLGNAIITGRNEDRAKISGPFDDIHIIGDLNISNGGAIYPEDVTSLLDIVGTETTSWINDRLSLDKRSKEKKRKSRYSEYVRIGVPITMDLMLHFKDNCFYVMNPCNFEVNPDSYLQLYLWDKYIFVKEAMFTSERGTMDLFGSTFQVDYVEVVVNQYLDKKGDEILGLSDYDVKIKASLYNKTADGTLITLDVIPQDQDRKNIIGNLQFQLRSDDPNDQTVMSMLSKLKYGRSHDEVTQQQQEALFQDEALYMAGAGVENIYINPFLSPVENTFRKYLHLDYFYIRPGIFRNLFYEYAGSHVDEIEPVEQESNMSRFSGILLNDLSVRLGKYLTRNLFVDYEFLVEKTTDIERTRMTLSHDFTVRYDLPWRFRLGYTYRLENDINTQVHQIMLEKSLRF